MRVEIWFNGRIPSLLSLNGENPAEAACDIVVEMPPVSTAFLVVIEVRCHFIFFVRFSAFSRFWISLHVLDARVLFDMLFVFGICDFYLFENATSLGPGLAPAGEV